MPQTCLGALGVLDRYVRLLGAQRDWDMEQVAKHHALGGAGLIATDSLRRSTAQYEQAVAARTIFSELIDAAGLVVQTGDAEALQTLRDALVRSGGLNER